MIRSDGIPYDEAVRVVARLLFGVARWSDDQMRDALHYLSEALLSGNVDASAVDSDSGVPVRLTAHKWMTYELVEYRDGRGLFLRPKGSMRRLGWLGDIRLDAESLSTAIALVTEKAIQNDEAASAEKRKPGRKQGYTWQRGRDLCRKLLDEHGLPSAEDPDLPDQEAIVTKVIALLTEADRQPAPSTVRGYVSRWIEEWTREKASGNGSQF